MRNLRLVGVLAVAAVAAGMVDGSASAEETQINCYAPSSQVSTGLDGTEPRFTIHCTFTNIDNIVYFAYKIAQSPATAQILQTQFDVFIQTQLASGLSPNIDVILYTDLSNKTGNSWGCSTANCRIIDYLTFLP